MELENLFSKYDRLVLFDTETTGLSYNRDEIIEFAAVVVEQRDGKATIIEEYDQLVTLSPGGFVPENIQKLTGITNEDIRERGIPKTRVCCDIARLIQGNTLLLAYNAHFDLSFLYYLLLRHGDPMILKGKDKLDLLNSHRAVDDVVATVAVMLEMERERDDLHNYVNLFGYNPKYGLGEKPIGTVTYKPQGYDPAKPLYEV